ncbi:unnamed protein product [Toxocara canis]|uniref:DUF3453 domain-containing protein n=1 Tax=Toxocara canis TaxID=6265 RepID=A0A183UY93_TOXCA|nr:unnamed protein product [Toxocara canis]
MVSLVLRVELFNYSLVYLQIAFQMLDLCHTLHVKAAGIYRSWAGGGAEVDASPSALWIHCWRPLVQCMARLCCDCRRQVRTQALNYLVRSFLIADMQTMSATEWENCFGDVLFPLVQKLLENLSPMDPIGMEETRVRAMQLISKILLNHLTPLSTLPSFPALWLRLLDYMDRYLHTDRSDLLSEAIPESLKNMILVLDNTGMFQAIPGLYQMTTTRMGSLLPELIAEVMPGPPKRESLETPTMPSEQVTPVEGTLADISEPAVISTAAGVAAASPTAVAPTPSASSSSAISPASPMTAVSASSSASFPVPAQPPITQFASAVGGRVQIAPPLEVFHERRSDSMKSDISQHSQSSELVEQQQLQQAVVVPSRGVEIPELVRRFTSKEEVIVQSSPGSPIQTHQYHGGHHQDIGLSTQRRIHEQVLLQGAQHVQAPPHLAHAQQTTVLQASIVDHRYSQHLPQSVQAASATPRTPSTDYVPTAHLYQSAPPHLMQAQHYCIHSTHHLPTTSLDGTAQSSYTAGAVLGSSPTRAFPIVPSPTSAFSVLPSSLVGTGTQHSDLQQQQPQSVQMVGEGGVALAAASGTPSTIQQASYINERP